MNEYAADYQRRFDTFLQIVASRLEQQIGTYLRDARNLDRITARAKDPERFAEKADRRDAQGRQKYSRPLTEIQDLLGARVVVFYRGDVDRIVETITRYFRPIEQRELVPDSQWAFGYFGQHLILPTPRDVIPEDVNVDEVPRFFELQIKTMFQHAWSEANHDLGYKPDRPLTTDQERLLAYTAAQAWGADRVFDELRVELGR
jgi:ppGpp synthetase/RelA/SpoT-type nucleotidyltranferase